MHSVGLNYIFPYRFSYEDSSLVKIWLRSQNSGLALLNANEQEMCNVGDNILFYQ